VSGKVAPDIAKPVPVSVAALMVTGVPPTDDNVRDFTDCVFTVTLPKPILLAFVISAGAAAFPTPLRPIVFMGAVGRLLMIVTSPPIVPSIAGRNRTLKFSAPPGARVTGSLLLSTREKDCPVT